jgi:hypothetical protein
MSDSVLGMRYPHGSSSVHGNPDDDSARAHSGCCSHPQFTEIGVEVEEGK